MVNQQAKFKTGTHLWNQKGSCVPVDVSEMLRWEMHEHLGHSGNKYVLIEIKWEISNSDCVKCRNIGAKLVLLLKPCKR